MGARMARYSISVVNNQAYQSFFANLGGRVIEFRVRWLTLYGFFAADLYEDSEAITLGRALHPNVNIVEGLLTGLGSISLEGKKPTLANFGVENRLVYSDE